MNSTWLKWQSAPRNTPVLLRYFRGNAPAFTLRRRMRGKVEEESRVIVAVASFNGTLWRDQLDTLICDTTALTSKNKPLHWAPIPEYVPVMKIYTFLYNINSKNPGSISTSAEDRVEAFKRAKRIGRRLKLTVEDILACEPPVVLPNDTTEEPRLEDVCTYCGAEGTIASTSVENSTHVCLNCGKSSN